MLAHHRPEERFAEELLRRILGIEVTQRDDGSSPRMPDALFDLPDGRKGALEVTTIGERDALEWEALAAKRDWRVAGAHWAWMIHVGSGVSIRDLDTHLPTLVLTCEAHQATDPRVVPYGARHSPAFDWFDESDLSMHGFPDTNRPGAIDVLPDGGGGAVYEGLDELPAWMATRLRQSDLASKIAKLRATDREDLHLFLRIHETAMPFSLYYPLAWGASVPTPELDPPEDLSGLWLVPAWRNPILWWGSGSGWRREDCLD